MTGTKTTIEDSEWKDLSTDNINRVLQFKNDIKEDIIKSMKIELRIETSTHQSLILQHMTKIAQEYAEYYLIVHADESCVNIDSKQIAQIATFKYFMELTTPENNNSNTNNISSSSSSSLSHDQEDERIFTGEKLVKDTNVLMYLGFNKLEAINFYKTKYNTLIDSETLNHSTSVDKIYTNRFIIKIVNENITPIFPQVTSSTMKKYTLDLNAKIAASTLKARFLNEERTNITDQTAAIVNNEESFTAPTMRTLVKETCTAQVQQQMERATDASKELVTTLVNQILQAQQLQKNEEDSNENLLAVVKEIGPIKISTPTSKPHHNNMDSKKKKRKKQQQGDRRQSSNHHKKQRNNNRRNGNQEKSEQD